MEISLRHINMWTYMVYTKLWLNYTSKQKRIHSNHAISLPLSWQSSVLQMACPFAQRLSFAAEVGELIWTDLWNETTSLNPLNAELNPICHLLALLGAHHILHVSRMRVKESRRKVTSYILYREWRLTALVTYGVGTAFCDTLLKER